MGFVLSLERPDALTDVLDMIFADESTDQQPLVEAE